MALNPKEHIDPLQKEKPAKKKVRLKKGGGKFGGRLG